MKRAKKIIEWCRVNMRNFICNYRYIHKTFHEVNDGGYHFRYDKQFIFDNKSSPSKGDLVTPESLENYFKKNLIGLENGFNDSDYTWGMLELVQDIFISKAFDDDFIIDLSLEIFLGSWETSINQHSDSGDHHISYLLTENPLTQFLITSESFRDRFIKRLTNRLICGSEGIKRLIEYVRSNYLIYEDESHANTLFASVLSQYEACVSGDLDRDIKYMTKNSDFNKNLSNLDVALMVASKSSRLQLLALESPETALKQRQQFLYGLIRDNNPLRASQRSVSYQVESRLYNYYVHQALIDNTYSFHKCSIPNYQDYSKDAFNEIISDKEIDYRDYFDSYFDTDYGAGKEGHFCYIFEVIQRYINEKNKGSYNKWR